MLFRPYTTVIVRTVVIVTVVLIVRSMIVLLDSTAIDSVMLLVLDRALFILLGLAATAICILFANIGSLC
jgi:hypothetical protein